jgi:LCP family protein required for cell wall assembly
MPTSAGRRLPRVLVAVAATTSLVLGASTAVIAGMWRGLSTIGVESGFPRGGVPPTSGPDVLPTGPCSDRACNYLLMGSDSRQGMTPEEQEQYGTEDDVGGDERADTVMLVHTDPDRRKAVILSFPRDLWVEIPGVGEGKLNSAFSGGVSGGGPLLMAKTIANLTGLRVDHFLYVDFDGFQGAVDTLGGVELCPPAYLANDEGRIVDEFSDLDIVPGCQRMDGHTALAFVRSRHLPCDNVPDFSRIGRQQQFFRALITQMLRPGQILRAPGLVQPILRLMRRDEDFLPGDLVHLVGQMRGLSTGAAEFRAVPAVGGMVGSIAVVRMDPSAEDLFAAIREGRPITDVGTVLAGTPVSPANVTIGVFDASSLGAAEQVETILGNAGFDISPGIWPAGQIPGGPPRGPAVIYAPGHDQEALVASKYLPGAVLAEVPNLSGAPVAVIVTPGYAPQEQDPGDAATCPSP